MLLRNLHQFKHSLLPAQPSSSSDFSAHLADSPPPPLQVSIITARGLWLASALGVLLALTMWNAAPFLVAGESALQLLLQHLSTHSHATFHALLPGRPCRSAEMYLKM